MEDTKMTDVLPTNYKYLLHNFVKAATSNDSFYANFYGGEDRQAVEMNLQANQWATGYVYSFHDRMLNSKLGPRVTNLLANKVVDNLVRIEGKEVPENDVETIKEIIKEEVLTRNIEKNTHLLLNRGQTLLRATYNVGKPLKLTVFPLPRYKVILDDANNVIEAWMYVNKYNLKKFEEYVLAEHRFMIDGQAYSETKVIRASWNNGDASDFKASVVGRVIENKSLNIPREIYEQLQGVVLDKKIPIPFMGCYLTDNKINSKLAYSNIGESQFVDAMESIQKHDTSTTYEALDEYLGKAQVLIPELGSATPQASGFGNIASMNAVISPRSTSMLDKTLFKRIESFNIGDQKPTVLQNELRAEQWKYKNDMQLADIAAACGISAIDLDPSVSNAVYKNDNEVDSQTDKTKATVKTIRSHLGVTYNKMLNDVAKALNIASKFFVRWSFASISNTSANDDIALNRYNAGIQSLEETVKQIHPDWDKQEIEEELNRLKARTDNQTIEEKLAY